MLRASPHRSCAPRFGHEEEDEALGFLAPATRPDSLGRISHYEVLQVLGKGGFGIVLRAFDDILQRVVAIKVMAPQAEPAPKSSLVLGTGYVLSKRCRGLTGRLGNPLVSR